ncbi:MAG: 50S ribosomal protein L5 [Candidatus Levybacteria bacterium]|nr:50S ribosomal protein L5 [Candidatus Levybacteria bacterium]
MNELKDKYKKEIAKKLQDELGIKNPMAVPSLSKIVVNMGVKDAIADKKNMERANAVLAQITGQKPSIRKAKKSIAAFKLREGDEIGVMVTLRGERMYDFFEKLVKIVLPRIRDFHGVNDKSFDGCGNYTLGISEYSVFPEIDLGKIDKIQGLEIVVGTTARDNKEGMALLKALGIQFKKS